MDDAIAKQSPYRLLGLMKTATDTEIDRAYAGAYRQAKRGEGDMTPERVNAAREALKNPAERAQWDVATFDIPLQPAAVEELMNFRGPYSQAGLRLRLGPEDIEPWLPPMPEITESELVALCALDIPVPDARQYLAALKRMVMESLDPWPGEALS